MPEITAIALASMQQDMQRVEHVATNLANVMTPGYKRKVAVSHSFAEMVRSVDGGQDTNNAADFAMTPLGVLDSYTDPHAGSLRTTGRRLDVALEGEGFFEIMTDTGPAYSRAGSFHLDAGGRLVDSQGRTVMGKAGEIVLTDPNPVIDTGGNILKSEASGDDTTLGQLKVVKFDDMRPMERLGDGLYSAGAGMTQLDTSDVRLRQGSLENSNVSTQQEMIELMQAMRHFESMQKAMQGYDEVVGTAIHKLGDV